MIRGQDYSHYQVTVNFPLAVASGQEWFYLKASEGGRPGRPSLLDAKYAEHATGARAVGKPFGPYHFLTMYQRAEEQVAWMRQCAPDPTPLPPILDAEQHPYEPLNSTVPLANKRTHVRNWLLEAERLYARRPLIYTGPYWWKDNIGDVPWAKDYQFIIAGYLFYKQVIPATFTPYWPGPRTLFYIPRENVIAWQYAGDIPNINNATYPWATGAQDFNVGDEAAIWKLANYKPPTTDAERLARLWAAHPELHP